MLYVQTVRQCLLMGGKKEEKKSSFLHFVGTAAYSGIFECPPPSWESHSHGNFAIWRELCALRNSGKLCNLGGKRFSLEGKSNLTPNIIDRLSKNREEEEENEQH